MARILLIIRPSVAVRKACRVCFLAVVGLLCVGVVPLGRSGVGVAAGAAATGESSRHNNNWAVLVRRCVTRIKHLAVLTIHMDERERAEKIAA